MKKKLLALLAAAALTVAIPLHILATEPQEIVDEGTVTVTTTVEASYSVTIPASATYAEGSENIGQFYAQAEHLEGNLEVTITHDNFAQAQNADKNGYFFSYTLTAENEEATQEENGEIHISFSPVSGLIEAEASVYQLYLSVNTDEYAGCFAGEYSSTITFAVEVA